jgi:1,4-alpha-glucan branching enzyme
MDYLAAKLGARQASGNHAGGAVEFKLFFPSGEDLPSTSISSIKVSGTFQSKIGGIDWDKNTALELVQSSHAEGTVWSVITPPLTEGFYEYKYIVDFTDPSLSQRWVTDPFARYGGKSHNNSGVVIGGSQPAINIVQPIVGGRKPIKDLIIYELMIDDFTDEYRGPRAPIDAVVDKLDYLCELGINAILFMPWTAWSGNTFNWGYDPYQYFSVEYLYVNDYTAPEEKISRLKKLITECHKRSIHVIMDGVFNHVGQKFPYPEFYQNPDDCPYTGLFDKDFPGLQDLNFNNQCTQEFIRDVCLYWITEFGIDGIRFDNTVNFQIKGRMEGLPQLLEDITRVLNSRGETNFSLTLEHLEEDAVVVTKDTDANSYWDNALHQKTYHSLWHGHIDQSFLNVLNNARFLEGTDKVPTLYLSNHDHPHVAWQSGARHNEGSNHWHETQPYAIALFTAPGAVMIQNGEEFCEHHWLPENDHNSGRRVQPRPLRWSFVEDQYGHILQALYQRLMEIRNTHPALCSKNFYPYAWEDWQSLPDPDGYGVHVENQIVIYHRWGHNATGTLQRFMIALNFSSSDKWVWVPFSDNGQWVDLISTDGTHWGTYSIKVFNWRAHVMIPSHYGRVFVQ